MGVRSLLFVVLLLVVLYNVVSSSSPSHKSDKSHKSKRSSRVKKAKLSSKSTGGRINGFPVIRSYAARNEMEAEQAYDPTTCGFPDGEIRKYHGRDLQIECGVLHTDGNYRVLDTSTFHDCANACALDIRCIALAWMQEKPSQNCYLKDSLPPPRKTKGARHPNIVGAKVVGGTLDCQLEPVTVLLPLSQAPAGAVCGRSIKLQGYSGAQAAPPARDVTLDQCFQLARNFEWVAYRRDDNICAFFNTDSASAPDNKLSVDKFDDKWYQYEGACLSTVDPCDPNYVAGPPATLPPPRTQCTHAPPTLKNAAGLEAARQAGARCGTKFYPWTIAAPATTLEAVSKAECYSRLFQDKDSGVKWLTYREEDSRCSLYTTKPTDVAPATNYNYFQYEPACFDFPTKDQDCDWPTFSPQCNGMQAFLKDQPELDSLIASGTRCGVTIREAWISSPGYRGGGGDHWGGKEACWNRAFEWDGKFVTWGDYGGGDMSECYSWSSGDPRAVATVPAGTRSQFLWEKTCFNYLPVPLGCTPKPAP